MSLYGRIKVFVNYCVLGLLGLLVFGPILLVFGFRLAIILPILLARPELLVFTNIIGILCVIAILVIVLV